MDKTEKPNLNSAPPNNLYELPSKTFKLKDFELKIFQGEKSIIFHASEKDDLSGTLYKIELDLENLYNLNRVFRQYNSIKDVFTDFFQKLHESKIIMKKEENKINLIIIIIDLLGQKNKFKINLMPEKTSIDNVVMKLCEKVKEIDKLNKIIDKQQNIIETQQKEFIEYKNYSQNKIKELEENFKFIIEYNNGVYFNSEEIIKLKEELPKFKEKLLYTQIMKNNELNLIETGIKQKLNKNIKKFR